MQPEIKIREVQMLVRFHDLLHAARADHGPKPCGERLRQANSCRARPLARASRLRLVPHRRDAHRLDVGDERVRRVLDEPPARREGRRAAAALVEAVEPKRQRIEELRQFRRRAAARTAVQVDNGLAVGRAVHADGKGVAGANIDVES